MRLRRERKLRRLVARLRGPQQEWLRRTVAICSELRTSEKLRSIALDSSNRDFYTRGCAARILSQLDAAAMARELLAVFYAQSEKDDLWVTALTIEQSSNIAAVPGLIRALYDSNPHRRHAAARALGWIGNAGPRGAKALVAALTDKAQPQPVREEAAESLAYLNYAPAIPPLISALTDPDVRIRFWAVFGLGSVAQGTSCRPPDRRAVAALESMLSDQEVAPGNWWSVGREALAMLGSLDPKYDARLEAETKRVLGDATATAEDRRWARTYGRGGGEKTAPSRCGSVDGTSPC